MEWNRYYLLLDLAETKNITKTAERLGYSQPGVSHILKNLEKEFGFPLAIREKYGVILTPAAELLLPQIRDMVSAGEKVQQTIYAINGLEYGKIVMATYSSIAIHILPKLLRNFCTEHPKLDVYIQEGGADNIMQWLDGNMVDFAFLSRPYKRHMEFIPFGKDPLMAVLPLDYPLKKNQKTFDIHGFEKKNFIISADGNDFDVHHALEKAGVSPDFRYSVLDDHSILSMVENGLGISILSELIVKGYEGKVKLLPLEPFCYRELGIGIRSYENLSPASKMFVKYVKEKLNI